MHAYIVFQSNFLPNWMICHPVLSTPLSQTAGSHAKQPILPQVLKAVQNSKVILQRGDWFFFWFCWISYSDVGSQLKC